MKHWIYNIDRKYFQSCRVVQLRTEMEGMAPGMSRGAWMLEYTMVNGVSSFILLYYSYRPMQTCLFLSVLLIAIQIRTEDWFNVLLIAIHIKHAGGAAVEGSHHATAPPAVREGQSRPN